MTISGDTAIAGRVPENIAAKRKRKRIVRLSGNVMGSSVKPFTKCEKVSKTIFATLQSSLLDE
jgi:hypothetical protein